MLPTTCFAEEDGSLTNSSRWLQWHWKAADPPGEAKSDIAIMSRPVPSHARDVRKDGGAFPDPILNLTWNYANPLDPSGRTRQGNQRPGAGRGEGRQRRDRRCAPASCSTASRSCGTTARTASRLLDLFRLLDRARQHDGAARRDRPARSRPRAGLGVRPGRSIGAFSTIAPAPIRRASRGTRPSRSSSGTASSGPASTCRISCRREAGGRCRAVHHAGRRHGAAVRPRPDARRPVP